MKVTLALGPSRFLRSAESLFAGEDVRESSTMSGVEDLGVAAVEETSVVFSPWSSSSTPNESLPLGAGLRFFFAGCWGVDTLYFDN